jgi:hypothetical protein
VVRLSLLVHQYATIACALTEVPEECERVIDCSVNKMDRGIEYGP